jgi:predicted dehydrogenase
MPLRLAIIGAGHLGRFHAKLAGELDDFELVGIVDPAEASARKLAEECRTRAFFDVCDIVETIDAAIVAAPTRLHHTIGRELLGHGVHALMEKPLAMSVEECDALVRLADQNRCVLQVGHIERFNPALDQALPFLHRPQYITALRHNGYTFRSTDVGVVLDLMVHDLDVAMLLVGSPVADVSALAVTLMGGHEDFARARLHFANGAVADFSASRVSYRAMREMQVWTETGNVTIDFATRSAAVAQTSTQVQSGQFDAERLGEEEKIRLRERFFEELMPVRQLPAAASNALLDEQRDFVSAIRLGREPRVTGRQGREVIAVAQRILASIAVHRRHHEASETHDSSRIAAFSPSAPTLRGDGAADILRGPHWDAAPAALPRELKRPA